MTILKMNPEEYSASAEYVPVLVSLLERRGIAQDTLLQGTDIAPQCWREPGARVPVQHFETLIRRAVELTGDPWLGWEFGAALTMSTHGFLGYAALSSETLGDAIELATKFFRTRITFMDLQLVIEGDVAALQLEELIALNDLAPFFVETLFSSFHFMALKVVPDLEMDGELRFGYPEPAYFRTLKPMIPVPCLFDCAYHQMRFPAQRLEKRLRFADPRLADMAAAQCEQELASIKAPPRLLGQVRRIVLSHAGRFPGVDEVATELHMSSRTLKRKLQQLGTSYQKVLDDLRKGLAVEHLTQTDTTVDDIALLLGYSDASNFARAFRRWTGRSPTDYRE
ncbi:AraC family transcriptional regulator [Isoalcanivorax indicus]|uniref:AraC family transcriptional regulator n=1 Tax=Isoalcanivorax indicus TaxID=2202653 RepID=UPI000DB95CE5|nr:AraC family transcriptional regulator [Isoalcanivorax indicus]